MKRGPLDAIFAGAIAIAITFGCGLPAANAKVIPIQVDEFANHSNFGNALDIKANTGIAGVVGIYEVDKDGNQTTILSDLLVFSKVPGNNAKLQFDFHSDASEGIDSLADGSLSSTLTINKKLYEGKEGTTAAINYEPGTADPGYALAPNGTDTFSYQITSDSPA